MKPKMADVSKARSNQVRTKAVKAETTSKPAETAPVKPVQAKVTPSQPIEKSASAPKPRMRQVRTVKPQTTTSKDVAAKTVAKPVEEKVAQQKSVEKPVSVVSKPKSASHSEPAKPVKTASAETAKKAAPEALSKSVQKSESPVASD
jgi:hypothetical protein